MLHIHLQDDGGGMTQAQLTKAQDPFYSDGSKHPKRKIGLGLPFAMQTAELTGGRFAISSEVGKGTQVDCSFVQEHIDTPPEGHWASMFLQALCFDGDYELSVHKRFTGEFSAENSAAKAGQVGQAEEGYTFTRSELQSILGDFNQSQNMLMLRDFLESQENGEAD